MSIVKPRWVIGAGVVAVVLVNIGNALSVLSRPWKGGTLEQSREWLFLVNENNPPTWVATTLWFVGALGAMWCAVFVDVDHRRDRLGWWSIAALLGVFSLDEAASIHERVGDQVDLDAGGVLTYTWVLPGALVVIALAIYLAPFIKGLPSRTRNLLILGFGLLVVGGLGVESIAGAYDERHGTANFTYHLISAVEENLEYAGSLVVLAAIMLHLRDIGANLRVD